MSMLTTPVKPPARGPRVWPWALIGLVLGLGLLGACSDDQAGNQAVHERFNKAVQILAKADQGYVPQGGETPSPLSVGDQRVTENKPDLQAYRQKVLAEAAVELEAILDRGSRAQQLATRRILADVYASQGRYGARQAMVHWASIADRSATLMSFLGSVDRADSHVHLFDLDEGPLLKQLRQDRADAQGRIKGFQKQTDKLNQQASKLNQQIDALKQEAQSATERARQLHGQALLATQGSEQYDLYDQSAQEDRRANAASTEVQKLEVELDVVKSELSVLDRQIRLARGASETLDKQISAAQRRQSRGLHQKAQAAKSEAIDQMVVHFNQIEQDYLDTVQGQMDQVIEKMSRVVELMAGAEAPRGDRDAQQSLELERLAHMVSMVHVLTEHILAASSHGHTLTIIAQQAQRLMPQQALMFDDHTQQIYKKQQEVIQTAKRTISDAVLIAQSISQGLGQGNPLADIATQQSQRLEAYRRRIDQLRLSPPTG